MTDRIEITGRKVEYAEDGYTGTVEEAVAAWRRDYPHFRIESINDEQVVAWCESCECPIFDGDEYGVDGDGIALCEVCLKEEPADG